MSFVIFDLIIMNKIRSEISFYQNYEISSMFQINGLHALKNHCIVKFHAFITNNSMKYSTYSKLFAVSQ